MYLKRLEIQGFKSFAKKTTLEFEPGITAIVGPNGSGKSNVADSIRWVLGEQSAKLMRGKKSEDVIFAGSSKRGGVGMAEVVATFDNTSRKIQLDAPEVSVGRRVNRNGDSEYFINGARVRLLDIVDLVLKSSIGTSRYTVIGQGTIDQLILAGPPDIKGLIDEASGVKTYYIKRDKTLRRLEQTAQNLMRAKDVVAELEPRLKSLRRQAKRQESRQEVEQELKILLLNAYANQCAELVSALSDVSGRLGTLQSRKHELGNNILTIQQELAQGRTQQETEQQGLLQARVVTKNLEEQRSVLTGRLAELRARLRGGSSSRAQLASEHQTNSSELLRLRNELQVVESDLNRWQSVMAAEQDKQRVLAAKLDDLAGGAGGTENHGGHLSAVSEAATSVADAIRQRDWEYAERSVGHLITTVDVAIRHHSTAPTHPSAENMQMLLKQQEALAKELQTVAGEVGSRQAASQELSAQIERHVRKISELEKDLSVGDSLTGQEEAILSEQKNIEEELANIEAKIALEESVWGSSLAMGKKLVQDQSEKERQLFLFQQEVAQLAEQISSSRVEEARAQTLFEELKKSIAADLGPHQVEIVEKMGKVAEEVDAQDKILRLKRQLEQIGGVDDLTLQEYQETEGRFGVLTEQINDLDRGMADLQSVIQELDGHIKVKFSTAFESIQAKFEHYFEMLFNGGKAQLVMVRASSKEQGPDLETEDGTEESGQLRPEEKIVEKFEHGVDNIVGIDIRATPPGKRLASIQALSGGERALTAIALLCAMLSCFPSPFVVLDEVDAALDEANTIRFGQILGTLAHQTQFVTITHNRETMSQSNILYGVTMDDDGVSKLLSLKFDQAQQFAK